MESKELIDSVAKKLGRDTTDVGHLVDALAEAIKSRCSQLDVVAVPGFGTFEAKKRNERVVVNPSSGRRMLVPPKITLGFKVSNVLKKRIK